MTPIEGLKEALISVKAYTLQAESGPNSQMSWNGLAQGQVIVEKETNSVRFRETGKFTPSGSQASIQQSNVYRWDFSSQSIRVYHERHEDPVFLVQLEYRDSQWISREPHLCGKDIYRLTLEQAGQSIHAHWHIQGPRKDENLRYSYLLS